MPAGKLLQPGMDDKLPEYLEDIADRLRAIAEREPGIALKLRRHAYDPRPRSPEPFGGHVRSGERDPASQGIGQQHHRAAEAASAALTMRLKSGVKGQKESIHGPRIVDGVCHCNRRAFLLWLRHCCARQRPLPSRRGADLGLPRIRALRDLGAPLCPIQRPDYRHIGTRQLVYRDVQPGTYSVTVDSFGKDVHQFANVSLGAGQTTFIKVESARDWESGLNYRRDTFYTRVISPEMAQRELGRSQFFVGG